MEKQSLVVSRWSFRNRIRGMSCILPSAKDQRLAAPLVHVAIAAGFFAGVAARRRLGMMVSR